MCVCFLKRITVWNIIYAESCTVLMTGFFSPCDLSSQHSRQPINPLLLALSMELTSWPWGQLQDDQKLCLYTRWAPKHPVHKSAVTEGSLVFSLSELEFGISHHSLCFEFNPWIVLDHKTFLLNGEMTEHSMSFHGDRKWLIVNQDNGWLSLPGTEYPMTPDPRPGAMIITAVPGEKERSKPPPSCSCPPSMDNAWWAITEWPTMPFLSKNMPFIDLL